MNLAPRRRGAPLIVLGTIVGSWIAVRIAVLSGSIASEPTRPNIVLARKKAKVVAAAIQEGISPHSAQRMWSAALFEPKRDRPIKAIHVVDPPLPSASSLAPVTPAARPVSATTSMSAAPFPVAWRPPVPGGVGDDKHWSADGWLLLRPGGSGGGRLLASYGASQAGAVLRYRLAPGEGRRSAAYLRAATALDGARQKEAAMGLSARPLPSVPLVAAVELRVTSDRFATRTRPAAFAYTEIPPLDLASGLRAEVYLQGGYVAGKGATGFLDGQVRLDRKLAALGGGTFRVGGGAWGGAQKGASRLDCGPGAQVTLPLSKDLFARAAIDWRFRVAGHAAPTSGPALTLSAGF